MAIIFSEMVLESLTLASNTKKKSRNQRQRQGDFSYHNLSTGEQYRLCVNIFNNATKKIFRLAKTLKDPYIANQSKLGKNLRYGLEDCRQKQNRLRMLTTMNASFNSHSNKVGVILPLSGQYADLARSTLEGIKAAVKSQNVNFDRFFKVLDSSGSEVGTEAAVARHLLKNEVAVLVGGLSKIEATVISRYSKYLRTPALLLNPNQDTIEANKNAFQVFPNKQSLAKSIVQKMILQKFNKIGILRPKDGRSDALINELKTLAMNGTIEINMEADYEPGNYESMDLAVQKLFDLTMETRMDEYKEMLEDRKKEAEEAGIRFKPETVILAPQYEFQVVLIPDDFRVLRHFVKLMQYHNVESMPLVGNHMWRSPEVLKPWDPFLEGSYFVDFIGSYYNLPIGIYQSSPKEKSEYFVEPHIIASIDYKLIGHRSGEIGLDVLRLREPKRRLISNSMLELKNKSSYFSGNQKVFNARRTSHWPVFQLALQKEGLRVQKSNLPSIATPLEKKNVPFKPTGWAPSDKKKYRLKRH